MSFFGTAPKSAALELPHETVLPTVYTASLPSVRMPKIFFTSTRARSAGFLNTTKSPSCMRVSSLAKYALPGTRLGQQLSPLTCTRNKMRLIKFVRDDFIRLIPFRNFFCPVKYMRDRIHRLNQLLRRIRIHLLLIL
jgi:hypothetical protein